MSILSNAIQQELDDREILTADFKLGGGTHQVASYPLSPADFIAINKKLPTPFQQDPTQFEGQIDMLIRKVRQRDPETGGATEQRMFDTADRARLLVLGVDKISGMFSDLFKDQITANEDEEDTPKGNS